MSIFEIPHSPRIREFFPTKIRLPNRRSQFNLWWNHIIKNATLILLSILFLPLNTTILILSYGLRFFTPTLSKRQQIRSSPAFYPKTILVTGVGMDKGLCLARMFYERGHDVVGADTEPDWIPVRGRMSRALKRFYRLSVLDSERGAAAYIHDLLAIVRREKVDLWVSVSGVGYALEDAQAKEIIERRTACKCIQFDVNLTRTLHEKHSFIENTKALGLIAPETHHVTSRSEIHKILNNSPEGKRWILKLVGVDEESRQGLRFLPRSSMSETYSYISSIDISPEKPYILQQCIRGGEYCTHSLVVNGEVKAFCACPSSDVLMHYDPLPPDSALNQAMLDFTIEYASRTGPHMTGHLSFDFMIDEVPTSKGMITTIYPIECNPRTHTAVLLLNGKSQEMVDAYLTALDHPLHTSVDEPDNHHHRINGSTITPNGVSKPTLVTPTQPLKAYYWPGHDLITLFLYPLFKWLTGSMSLTTTMEKIHSFIHHLLFWKDGTYQIYDPLPWWWCYHVYWPAKFLMAIWKGERWVSVNVSTKVMFPALG